MNNEQKMRERMIELYTKVGGMTKEKAIAELDMFKKNYPIFYANIVANWKTL